jgi:3'-5' exoribonuclease
VQLINNILVKVKGSVVEWQGKKQVKIDKIRPAIDEDGVDIREFIPVAPLIPKRCMLNFLITRLKFRIRN